MMRYMDDGGLITSWKGSRMHINLCTDPRIPNELGRQQVDTDLTNAKAKLCQHENWQRDRTVLALPGTSSTVR
jgi:hypothetical protein